MKYDCPARFCPRKDHTECWKEYERDMEREKYRGSE